MKRSVLQDLGLQQHRLDGDDYLAVVDEFMEAVLLTGQIMFNDDVHVMAATWVDIVEGVVALDQMDQSKQLPKATESVYVGRWFDTLRESMVAFMQKMTKTRTGSVTLKLYKGFVTVTSRTSHFSFYGQDISSLESGQIYDQADAVGFIRLYGLPMRVRAMLEQGI
ncbi:argininosuccinate synthase, chloroplastic-like [Vigna angularis]|uniref:argininosuccinate synthase, chloroplastic-like n=1 Tax=Phaseolus angularis TaxID=3914 RepID=UPI0022B32E85|nr:argininosuccinate synthase, chloroplastic-like [Vigna angularis]